MKRWFYPLFLVVFLGFCLGLSPCGAAGLQKKVLSLDWIRPALLKRFDCRNAMFDPNLSLTNPIDRAVVPGNYLYPVFEWESSDNYRGMFLLKLESGSRELNILLKKDRWQPAGNELAEFLAGKEFKVTVFTENGGKTYRSNSVRVLVAGPLQDHIVYRLVQPLFNPTAPNAVKVFSFNRRSPGTVIAFEKDSCAGCHGYSSDAAFFNIKQKLDRRVFMAKRSKASMEFAQKSLGEFTFFSIFPRGGYAVFVVNANGQFINKPTVTEPFDYPYQTGDIYLFDEKKDTIAPLKGASDPNYVEDMPVFSPDGRSIVFSRYKFTKSDGFTGVASMGLYQIPFNKGRGGVPVPVQNASADGKWHYFAQFSPNGKWLSFCRGDARQGVFARQTSDIYLLSRAGNRLFKMKLNMDQTMDSWHYWSSDSHWLIFSSNRSKNKLTALYMVYVDDNGRDSPPVKLIGYDDMKVNTPQFVPAGFDFQKMKGLKSFIDQSYATPRKK